MDERGDLIPPERELDGYIVRRNVGRLIEIRFRRSATRHRVSRERSLYVVRRVEWALELPPPADAPDRDPRLLFLGEDRDRVVLEVIAVEPEARLFVVIHSMPLRERYREAWKEVERWAE